MANPPFGPQPPQKPESDPLQGALPVDMGPVGGGRHLGPGTMPHYAVGGRGTPWNPGDIPPQWHVDPGTGGVAPPALTQGPIQGYPGAAYDNFLPPAMRDPFIGGLNAAAQVGSAVGMGLPNAAGFHASLYSPFMNPMEQQFLGSAGALGLRGLSDTLGRVEGQFENSPMHGSLGPAMMDQANQFALQMANVGGQMGMQRMNTAAQTLPFSFGFPLQAAQAGQESAAGLYNMGTQGMFGDMGLASANYSQFPFSAPVAQVGRGGSKGK